MRAWAGRGGAIVERGRVWRVWRAEACGAGHPELSLLTRLGLLNPDDDSAIFGARCQHLPRALKSPTIEYACRSEKSSCRKLTVDMQISPHLPELRMRPINLSIKESRCSYEPKARPSEYSFKCIPHPINSRCVGSPRRCQPPFIVRIFVEDLYGLQTQDSHIK